MSFSNPWMLGCLPLVLYFYFRQLSVRSIEAPSLTHPTQTDTRLAYRWLPPVLQGLTLIALVLALAGPEIKSTQIREKTQGIAIQLLVDISSSMDMRTQDREGQSITRMELAKALCAAFIGGDGDRLSGRPHDLIGLITFARYADTRSPLTFGHQALLDIVQQLKIQDRPNEDGTAYGDALAIAAARLHTLPELNHASSQFVSDSIASKVIILLTDGENNSGTHLPTEAAGLAKKWGCRIYAISLGDASEYSADQALSPAEEILQHLCRETGGYFRQAYDFESMLAVYAEIDQLEKVEIKQALHQQKTAFFWLPLLVAIISLIGALSLETTWLRTLP
ncbi:MAG: vWA domain-containing protein [Opitutales bacterium]